MEALLRLLEEHAAGIRKAAEIYDACINCYFFRETSTPGFHLSRDSIARVAVLALPIDFDIYAFPPDEDESSS